MHITSYTREQFAEAVFHLLAGVNGGDKETLIRLHRNLKETSDTNSTYDLARNAAVWADAVEKNIHFGNPKHTECLEKLIINLRVFTDL